MASDAELRRYTELAIKGKRINQDASKMYSPQLMATLHYLIDKLNKLEQDGEQKDQALNAIAEALKPISLP